MIMKALADTKFLSISGEGILPSPLDMTVAIIQTSAWEHHTSIILRTEDFLKGYGS